MWGEKYGESAMLNDLRAQMPPGIVELSQVRGLNVKKVEKLQDVGALMGMALAGSLEAEVSTDSQRAAGHLQARVRGSNLQSGGVGAAADLIHRRGRTEVGPEQFAVEQQVVRHVGVGQRVDQPARGARTHGDE